MINKFIEFVIFGSIFISLCAVAMCVETNLLLNLPLNKCSFYAFVFGATLSQYNLHYLIKKNAHPGSQRFLWSVSNKSTHRFLLLFGCVLMGISIFSFHFKHFVSLACMSAISLLYSLPVLPFRNKKRIKDFGLLKIITLSLLWTLVTVWFPLVESEYKVVSFQLVFIRRFLFIFILCLMFDIRDIAVDEKGNIKTLPVMIGIQNSLIIIYALLFVFIFISLIQYLLIPDIIQFITMFISAITTFILILYGRKQRNDFYFLAGIDGMMLYQASLVFIGKIYFT